MKRGDKLYCYNNITENVNINVKMYITVGKYYNIYNLIYRKNNTLSVIQLMNDNNQIIDFWYNPFFETNFNISKYFVTLKQERKLKLEKLCLK